jgi:hypothetical protein
LSDISLGNGSGLRRGSLLSFLAVGADAEDAMAVMKRFEIVTANYLVLQLLDLLVVELDQRAACGANKMIVMRVLIVMFVQGPPIVKLQLASEAALF